MHISRPDPKFLSVNDDYIYLDSNGTEDDLKKGIQSFVTEHADGEIKKFHSLELVIDKSLNGIRYAIDISASTICIDNIDNMDTHFKTTIWTHTLALEMNRILLYA